MPIRRIELPGITAPFESVLGRLGYNPKKSVADESILQLVNNEIEASRGLLHPRGNVLEDNITGLSSETIQLQSGLSFHSKKLSQILENSKLVTLMALTIGHELKAASDDAVKAGELTRGVVLDAIASEAVEAFADYITEVISREKRIMGWRATMRYSPGYGDLKTDVHPRMLSLLEAGSIGLSCDPMSYILSPEKSITAILGWVK